MQCAHCGVRVKYLNNDEGQGEWVHSEPGDPPFRHCKLAKAEPNTMGNWAARFLDVK